MLRFFRYPLVFCALFFLLVSVGAQAQDMTGIIYLQFQAGLSGATDPDIKLDDVVSSSLGNTLFFGGGAAYQFNQNIRFDFTVTYRGGFKQKVELGDNIRAQAGFQSTAAMFGATYEFMPWKEIRPYVAGGLGYVYNHLEQVTITRGPDPLATIEPGGWANLGGQIGGGITFPIYNDWRVDVGYRYFDGGKYESSDTIHLAGGVNQPFTKEEGNLSANEIVVGLRIRLN